MKKNKKGFTLAELLIVVAIIAVLVAIAIPVFSAQLEKSKLATDTANVRSAYAEVVADALGDGGIPTLTAASMTAKLPAASINSGTTVALARGQITVTRGTVSNTIAIDTDIPVTASTITGTKAK